MMPVLLFDVDGTLTVPRNRVTQDMKDLLQALRKKHTIGVVGGSDLAKIKEQLGDSVLTDFDYVFAENGLVAYKDGQPLASRSISEHLGEAKLQSFINACLRYLAELELPVKRGTFIEFRRGMLNVSPIGRNCSQSERDAFETYDQTTKVRETMIKALKAQFPDLGLTYSIGGQISFDVFPEGWNKTYCLRFLDPEAEVHFWGDKTDLGGNDHEIYTDPRVKGHSVKSYKDTMEQLTQGFM